MLQLKTVDVLKLFFIIRHPTDWKSRWFSYQLDQKNINLWEELEQPMVKGESFKEYRMRLEEVSRKIKTLREESKKTYGD